MWSDPSCSTIPPGTLFVRFEDAQGRGLFRVASYMLDCFDSGQIRITRQSRREIDLLCDRLWDLTPPANARGYQDTRSLWPITWYLGIDSPPLHTAEQLVRTLNRYRADIRRVERRTPPMVFWCDSIQAITRAPRTPSSSTGMWILLERRYAIRRARQQRRRMRKGRQLARAFKSAC